MNPRSPGRATPWLLLGFLAFESHAGPITALAFSPDGSALVSNGPRCLQIRSPSDAAAQRQWDVPLPKITALRFDAKGRWLAVAGGIPGERGEAQILAWPDGRPLFRATLPADLAMDVDFSPDGTRLVVGGANHVAYVWNVPPASPGQVVVSEPSPVLRLTGHAASVLAVGWDPSGDQITTAGADRSIQVWSAETGQPVRAFTQHTEPANVLRYRPAPQDSGIAGPSLCASGGDDRTIRIWQPGLGRMVRIVRKHLGRVFALAWMPDGRSLYSAGAEGQVRRIDGASDEILAEWHGHDDWIFALAINPDGTRLASGDASGNVKIWNLR